MGEGFQQEGVEIVANPFKAYWAVVLNGKIIAMFDRMDHAQDFLDGEKMLEWDASVEMCTMRDIEILVSPK